MNSLEAITRLIEVGNKRLEDQRKQWVEQTGEMPEVMPDEEQLEVATAVMQAILNTAIPIARFRAHVTIDKLGPSAKTKMGDFTVSGPSIICIRNGLLGLSYEALEVHVTLWHQKKAGADMISGYQGHSKSHKYRLWLSSIDELQFMPDVPYEADVSAEA